MLWLPLPTVFILSLWFGTVHTCVDNYLIFEEETFSNNSENRMKLYQAFYTPNTHLPYSVIVTYQAVLNGARVNISADPSCPYTQVWIWLSSPTFLYLEPTSLNRHTLFTLNYFEEWTPPRVTITVPYPCQDQAERFMQEMTTSLQSYAVGQTVSGRFKGNVATACGADSFLYKSEGLAIVTVLGLMLIGLFVHLAVPVIFQSNKYLQAPSNANNYSFGLFWGVSTLSFVIVFIVLFFDMRQLMQVWRHLGVGMQLAWAATFIIFPLTFRTAKFISAKSTFTVPGFYLFLAEPFCSGSEPTEASECVTCMAILFDMLALQLLCHHGVVAILAVPAAPLTIFTNMLLLVLVGTTISYTLAFMFTVCSNQAICSHAWNCLCLTHGVAEESSNSSDRDTIMLNNCIYRAGILIPFLGSITLFSLLLAFSGRYVNNATEQNNFPTFLLSIIPLLLGGIGLIDLKWFYSKWLKNDISQLEPPESPQQQAPQERVVENVSHEQLDKLGITTADAPVKEFQQHSVEEKTQQQVRSRQLRQVD